ncbi:Holliday junction resolvase RuvX [Alteriqipengyuania lutimaris]|uniref:Putative pre-16S rRNA nuclease n=1 Tax=Alteriqipengyuania lutimaris TaxID=1538146 RepID=A0A395LLC9_9SPHN|nr:Holliday junction resolvase RuvX [Alteriqipengyuania lutimaris]MBB3033209.1 putative Holliday junction resolvase [Alteriqipengyuania lutimaris]RDS77742.1 Holliday junction resolvase RuvX [Alteriqipengyuania lutimaris]
MGGSELVGESAARLAEALPDGGALIGLDLGTKTIGVAVCDAGWRFANALKTLPRGKFGRDRDALRQLVDERGIRGFVLGLPRNMDGSEGPRAQASRAYARNLAEAFALPVLLWDERWSTKSADDAMIGLDVSRRKRAERIDAEAAAVILQAAIDAASNAPLD